MEDYEKYEALISKHSGKPLPPLVGFPVFALAFAAALFGKNIIGGPMTGIVMIFSLFLFPYYVMQLLMQRAMQKHLDLARILRRKPSYVPRGRSWPAIYIVTFFVTAYAFFGISSLVAKT